MRKLLCLLGLFFAFSTSASAIPEGAIVKTVESPDVYIIKYNNGKQYKRLVLNPQVFQSYGHLKWENLLTISQEEMNSFIVSDLVRVDGTSDVYQLFPDGDAGSKYSLSSTRGYDMDSVYTINSVDFANYTDNGVMKEKTDSKIVLYYSDLCPHCMNVENYLAENNVQAKVVFLEKNVRTSTENATELMDKAALCGIPSVYLGVPFLWDGENGNQCLMGDNDIINFFESKIGSE